MMKRGSESKEDYRPWRKGGSEERIEGDECRRRDEGVLVSN